MMAELTIEEPLTRAAMCCPQQIALQYGGQQLSFAQLYRLTSLICEQLKLQGVRSGDHLMVVSHNSLEMLSLLLASLRMGVLFCPVSPRFSEAELLSLRKRLDIRWCWSEQGNSSITLELPADFAQIEDELPLSPLQVASSQWVNIILSSGSTGEPKAVVHTLANHYFSAMGSVEQIPLMEGDCWLLTLPLFHIGGLATVMRTLYAGATLLLPKRDEPVAQLLCHQRVTHLSFVATQLWRLLQLPVNERPAFDSVKACLLGGGAVPTALLQQASRAGIPCFISYGLSEMSSQVATAALEAGKVVSCGFALPHRELSLIDGEICVRGDVLAAGYYRQGQASLPLDLQGWFHTGDLGRWSDAGLVVTGRRSNLFISGGENIYPEEIEQNLLRLPEVAAAVVVAVPDPEYGERPLAFLQWQAKPLPCAQLRDFLQSGMARFKCPDYFLVWPQQLRGGLKPSRPALQQFALRYLHDALQPLPDTLLPWREALVRLGIYELNDLHACRAGQVVEWLREMGEPIADDDFRRFLGCYQ